MTSPPRLLVLGYACAPGRGSEWGISWNFVREFARTQPLWLITHEENRKDLEPYLAAHPTEHPIHIEYVMLPRAITWLGSLCYTLFNVQYYLWQHAAARAARRLHAEHQFETVQHVSLIRWWMPTAAATLADRGATFIFGPIGGGEQMPRNFVKGIGLHARLSEMMRGIAVRLWGLDPALRRSVKQAAVTLASTPEAAKRLAGFSPRRLETMSVAMTSAGPLIDAARAHRESLPANRPFRMVSSGGLSYYRGVDLSLRAFAQANLENAEYVHASDGPDRPRLEVLARSLGIVDRVKFLGDQPHAENIKIVASADVYVHTVTRDSMGLIPDALALGVPVLTLDHNSMALLVDETCGHKVVMDNETTPERVIDELASVMKSWHADAAVREQLGLGAVIRSEHFTPAGRVEIFRAMHAALRPSCPSSLSPGTPGEGRGEGLRESDASAETSALR